MCHLRVYHLAVEFYQEAKTVKLPYFLKDQLRRAALSIALNLSEATGKSSMRDRKRFYEVAFGSIRECHSILHIESRALNKSRKDLLDHLAAATHKLIHNSRLNTLNPTPSALQPRYPNPQAASQNPT